MPQIGDVMMKNMIPGVLLVAAVTGFFSSLHADAVQWRVEDGGNGHWYAAVQTASPSCWDSDRDMATAMGGYLATITSGEENAFVFDLAGPLYPTAAAANIGGYQDIDDPDYSEPGGAWKWVTGESFDYTNWQSGEPGCCGPVDQENWLDFNTQSGRWRDRFQCLPSEEVSSQWAIIEWSSDCNGDGIVDYGQILDGTFADEDANGVPDCCESGVCIDTIQWRIEDGGNGHWYRLVSGDLLTWSEASDQATALGGYLATPTSPDENTWIYTEFDISDWDAHWHTPSGTGPALGGFWDAGQSVWEWRNGEVWSWNNLIQPLPSDPAVDWGSGYTTEDGVPVPSEQWQHFPFDTPGSAQIYHKSFVVEFTSLPGTSLGACCLDGYCLTTTASDCMANGGSWGGADSSCTDYDCAVACAADLNGDGKVGPQDLALLLGSWGFCP